MINKVVFDRLHPAFTPGTRRLLTSILSELPLDIVSSEHEYRPAIGLYVRSTFFRSRNARDYALVPLGSDNVPVMNGSYEFVSHNPVAVCVLENYAHAFLTVRKAHIRIGLLLERPKEDQQVLFE